MPDYLQDTAVGGGEVNFADRGIQLTRSVRAIKIWLSLRYFGVDAFRAAIDRALDLTEAASAASAPRASWSSSHQPVSASSAFDGSRQASRK